VFLYIEKKKKHENHQDIRWSNLIQLGDPKQLYDKVRNEAFEFIKNFCFQFIILIYKV